MLVQLATLKFVARQVEHAVVRNTGNNSFNLQCNNVARQVAKSVARITGPLVCVAQIGLIDTPRLIVYQSFNHNINFALSFSLPS